jgi:acyl-CoA dehydrogenase
MMVSCGLSRDRFGQRLAKFGGSTEMIAKVRIEIESMHRMVLTAANAMDKLGNSEARVWVSAVKAMVPIRVCEIID